MQQRDPQHLLNPLATGKEHPHLVHHGKNPIHPLLWCVLLLRKLHCVSLQQQDRTRSHTHLCPAWRVSPGKDCPPTPHIRTGCKGTVLALEPPSATRSRHCPRHDGHDGHNPPPTKEGIGGVSAFPSRDPQGLLSLCPSCPSYHHLINRIHNVQHLVPRDVSVVVQVVQLKRPCRTEQQQGLGL